MDGRERGDGVEDGRGTTHDSVFRFVSMGRHFAMASPVVSVKLLLCNLLVGSRGVVWANDAHVHTHTHTYIHIYGGR